MLISCEYDTGDNISKVKYRDGGYKKYTYDEYDNFQMNVLYNKNQTVGSTLYMCDKEDVQGYEYSYVEICHIRNKGIFYM